MLVTTKWMSDNYNKYNKMYWNGKLPNITFKLSRSKKTWGFASYHYNLSKNSLTPTAITMSNYYDSPENVKLTTLLHEMIHIAEYTLYPNRFINNGRKLRYDAHGWWFKSECARLAKFGWDIEKYVTNKEQAVSTLSERSKLLQTSKVEHAVVCVVTGSNGYNWFFKTSECYVSKALRTVAAVDWKYTIGTVRHIKIYKFDDVKLATKRNQAAHLRGWKYDKTALMRRLEEIKATEVHNFTFEVKRALMDLAV